MLTNCTAYFDESENAPAATTSDQLRVYMIAGCIGLNSEWDDFQKKWKAALETDVLPFWEAVYGPDVPVYFHMSDFSNPHDSVYGLWSEEKKKSLLQKLHRIMREHTFRRFATGILINDYDQLTDEEKFAVGHPHVSATINCLKRIREWANRENYGGRMPYVFERGSVHDPKIRKLFEVFLDDEMKAEYRVLDLTFKDKRDAPPLQSADIIATETRWEVCRQFDKRTARKQRQSLKNLYVPTVDEWYFIDKTHLRAILDNPSVQKLRNQDDLSSHVAPAKRKGWI